MSKIQFNTSRILVTQELKVNPHDATVPHKTGDSVFIGSVKATT